MNVVSTILVIVCAVIFFGAYVAPAAWAVGDAQKRGVGAGSIVLLIWFFGPISALVWLAIRPRTKIIDRSPNDHTNAEDALADASRLDHLGEWDAAVLTYQHVANRWPEHADYAANCIESIDKKRSAS